MKKKVFWSAFVAISVIGGGLWLSTAFAQPIIFPPLVPLSDKYFVLVGEANLSAADAALDLNDAIANAVQVGCTPTGGIGAGGPPKS